MNYFKTIKDEGIDVRLAGIRPLNNKYMIGTVVVRQGPEGRHLEDKFVVAEENLTEEYLDEALIKVVKKFLGVDSVDKAVDKKPKQKATEEVKVMIGDTPVEKTAVKRAVKKITKKKTMKNRKTKSVVKEMPEDNPFREDPIIEMATPIVPYDPKNEVHKLNLNNAVVGICGKDWKTVKHVKEAVLRAVQPLKKQKCMMEDTGDVTADTITYLTLEVNHALQQS